ncbi:unnamed protein product [Gongylonema pulchrum]|uniref:G_PROTEIN_RECEP_F1_2 domain-containing protein n=1 Tax=Gongylonema pulchrum TaxID=637853 RepID=A0A183EJI0_9BILA|nr:unnamed protein product [Gongylonema pulchrum]
MAIYVLIVETTLKAVPGLIMVVSTTAGSTVMVNIMAYVTGMSNPICHACHPFIFALAHRDFKEILYRRSAQLQKGDSSRSGAGKVSVVAPVNRDRLVVNLPPQPSPSTSRCSVATRYSCRTSLSGKVENSGNQSQIKQKTV